MRKNKLLPALTVLALFATLAPAYATDAPPIRLDLKDPAWEIEGDGAVVEEVDGQVALRLMSGSATYRDIEFLDGTIEFDLRITEYRSFAYIYFRMASDDEHEEIYFRSHKSRLPDAIQYAPVFNNRSQWQLYHAAGSTAAAHLPPEEWIPIRLVVQGTQAAVFVGAVDEPQLIIHRLAHDPQPGFLALRSFMARGTPPDILVSNFANVVVRPGVVNYEFPEPEAPESRVGQVSTWELSPAFAPAEGDILKMPADVLESAQWKPVSANPDGLVEIERHIARPEGARRASVLARLRIAADEASIRRLDLGFSDEISVFLNGRLLAVDNDGYSFNFPRRQGLLTPNQISIFLPLEKGDNELVLAVTDSFGGWGLSGRWGEFESPRK